MNDDELIRAGVYDPATDAPSRAALVRRCLELGLTLDEIAEAGEHLVDRAVQRLFVAGDEHLTLEELAAKADVPMSVARQFVQIGGIEGPAFDPRRYGANDVAVLSSLLPASELFGEEAALQMLRVATASIARIGDAAISTFFAVAGAPALRDDQSGLRLLEANVLAASMIPTFGQMLTYLLEQHLRNAFRPTTEASIEEVLADGVDARPMAIGFADLVGSTTIAGGRTLAELNTTIEAFERAATDAVASRGGRIVKFIGDEVMFRADTTDTACAIALDLVESVRADPVLPPLRVGIAFGRVLMRDGDFHGTTVNLAARVAELAPLHGVVATLDTTSRLADTEPLVVEPLGAIEMRGFPDPVELAAVSSRRG